jgi:hypothetical protein
MQSNQIYSILLTGATVDVATKNQVVHRLLAASLRDKHLDTVHLLGLTEDPICSAFDRSLGFSTFWIGQYPEHFILEDYA